MTTPPVVVVGGGIGALVAADTLAAAGRAVDLHLPERGLGGGFLPIEAAGRRLDLGPRLIELQYDAEPGPAPDLGTYVAGPHGHRPFLATIGALVRDLAGDDLEEVAAPRASVRGTRTPDHVLLGDLSGLADAIPADELAVWADQAGACVAAEGPHGAHAPARRGELDGSTLAEAGPRHTGTGFHDVMVGAVVDKLLPGGSADVVAALHRKVWVPLFHPQTVLEACTGALTYRPDRPFHTVAGGGMGEVVQRLVDRVVGAPGVAVHHSGRLTSVVPDGDDVVLVFEDGSARTATRPVLGASADEVFGAAGAPVDLDRMVTTMVWVDLPDGDVADLPPVLTCAEPELGIVRVTENRADVRTGWRTACVELGWTVPAADRGAVARADLVRCGVAASVDRAEVVVEASRPGPAVPSPANRDRFAAAAGVAASRLAGVALVGSAVGFGVDSFNEQVVQGLRAAAAHLA